MGLLTHAIMIYYQDIIFSHITCNHDCQERDRHGSSYPCLSFLNTSLFGPPAHSRKRYGACNNHWGRHGYVDYAANCLGVNRVQIHVPESLLLIQAHSSRRPLQCDHHFISRVNFVRCLLLSHLVHSFFVLPDKVIVPSLFFFVLSLHST